MLKNASVTLSRGYNIEKGRGGRNVKIGDSKTHAFNETGLFRGVSRLLLSMIARLCVSWIRTSFLCKQGLKCPALITVYHVIGNYYWKGVLFCARTKETGRESGQQFALSSESQLLPFALVSFESSSVLIALFDFFSILSLICVGSATLSPTSSVVGLAYYQTQTQNCLFVLSQ